MEALPYPYLQAIRKKVFDYSILNRYSLKDPHRNMDFFISKGKWLHERYDGLTKELYKRGFFKDEEAYVIEKLNFH